ncbi:MAG TPA: 50S ribosomal protein L9 [Caulifigura sp.]|jgi:large subunit ribosomal protein L9|nr:50S ribosomal protein L9 [Caulifigura sp.]
MPLKRKDRVTSAEQRGGVELMLAENVPSLGDQGEIVRVKRGYARNYLLPNGLATVATAANKEMVERHKKRQDAVQAQKVKEIRAMADKVKDYSVTLEANSTEDGHLYGSIVAVDIAKALKAANYPVEPEHVKLDGPLKELGMYTIKLQFHPEITTDVKVWVVPTSSIR